VSVSITLTFESYDEAADALEKLRPRRVLTEADAAADLAGVPRPSPKIAPEDTPSVGRPLVEPVTASAPPAAFNPFATSVTAVAGAPLDAGVAVVLVPPPPSVPTPPAATIAPTAATAPIAAPVAGLELDVHGLPWDARIHADAGKGKPHPKIGDGSWRKKRGVEDATVAAVEAELRAAMGASAPSVPSVPPPGPSALPPPPPVVVPVPPVPGVAPNTFATLISRIAPTMTKTPGAHEIIATILKPYGLGAIGQLATVWANDPPLFARIGDELTAALGVA
jgi:hypothetical protein